MNTDKLNAYCTSYNSTMYTFLSAYIYPFNYTCASRMRSDVFPFPRNGKTFKPVRRAPAPAPRVYASAVDEYIPHAGPGPDAMCFNQRTNTPMNIISRPQIMCDYPLNLSILIRGGKETNKDSLSSCERNGRSSARRGDAQPASTWFRVLEILSSAITSGTAFKFN